MVNKIDSNITGLRYAEEDSLKVLPVTPVWYPLEPNSYSDFGGELATIARDPINPSRQRKKGVITDLDASGGFSQDLTFSNLTRLLQGFFFADIREKMTTAPLNAASVSITGVVASTDTYSAASGLLGFLDGQIILASGFSEAANNGLKTVNGASTATDVVVNEALADETPSASASLRSVGYAFSAGSHEISMNGSLARLTRTTGSLDLNTLGLIPGEWVFLGGDGVNDSFADNVGFARVKYIDATYIEFDKTSWAPQTEAAGSVELKMYFGDVLRNEPSTADIKRRTYQIERTLGSDNAGVMSEYLVGAVANEISVNIPQADKITMDLSFVAVDNEQRNGTTGVKTGSRPTLSTENAYNTSSDFARIKLSTFTGLDANPNPLFAYATELNLTVNNNVTPNKAVGVLGAFDTSAGTFEVGGSMTVYFADVEAVAAVRNNTDVTLDIIILKDNSALIWDLPLLALGDGRLNVEKDAPITLPLELLAAEGANNHTLLLMSFPHLPDIAG